MVLNKVSNAKQPSTPTTSEKKKKSQGNLTKATRQGKLANKANQSVNPESCRRRYTATVVYMRVARRCAFPSL